MAFIEEEIKGNPCKYVKIMLQEHKSLLWLDKKSLFSLCFDFESL